MEAMFTYEDPVLLDPTNCARGHMFKIPFFKKPKERDCSQMAVDSGTGYKIRVGLMASQCYWSLLDESSL